MQDRTVPTVSVVMPAYNAEKYIREAIDSILAQTFTDFEFIIINDGSTDATKDIILSYTDPRIIYIENEHNSGICVTLNKGLDTARGRYIARMDSDDISLPQRFAKQVDYMEKHPETGVLGSDIVIFGEDVHPYIFTQPHTPEECQAGLLFNSCFAHPSVMIRKSVIESHSLCYKDQFRGLEDYELWWQISKYSRLNNIPETLLQYRLHKGQETQNISQRVKTAFENFTSIRMNDLRIRMSLSDFKILNDYSNGRFDDILTNDYERFLSILKLLLGTYKSTNDTKLYAAVKSTITSAMTNTILKSSSRKKAKLYYKAWIKGLLPTLWYLKINYLSLKL